MVNPFAEIDWNPDRPAVKAFGRIVVIVSVIVAPVAFGLYQWLDKPFFLFLARMFSVFLGLGAISYLLPAIGKYIYKVWYFLSACIGLVVTNVDEMSDAFEKGLRNGDVIAEAGQEKVASIADLKARIDDARDGGRKSLLLLVRRDGDPRFVALSVE